MRVIPYYNVAWSSRDPARRNVGCVTPARGWPGFVESIGPLAGRFHRVWFHNPFGALAGEPMQFAQWSQAKKQGLSWLTEKFDTSVRRITDAGIEAVAYIGSPRLLVVRQGESFESWQKRAFAEMQPLMDAGCSIGFDATYGGPEMGPRSYPFRLIQMLPQYRIKVYCEPWPLANSPHMFNQAFIMRESFYLDNRQHPKWVPANKLRGEVIRLLLPQPKDLPAKVAQVNKDGHTALVGAHRIKELSRL
jgi:hypothetical protein